MGEALTCYLKDPSKATTCVIPDQRSGNTDSLANASRVGSKREEEMVKEQEETVQR